MKDDMSAPAETAYAKLNLALHVRERMADGYHRIETLFAFVEEGDRIVLTEAPGLAITGPFADGLDGAADNLVSRAERAYRALLGGQEAGFALDKRLPIAAGIGGGSADAAAALRLLCRRDDRNPLGRDVVEIAAALGADVPACLASATARGEDRGDRLTPAENALAGMPVLLVNPRVALPTGPVFAGWDAIDHGPLVQGDALAAALAGRNDLEPPARALRPVIGEVVALLAEQPGVVLARMSGSGATCFALLETGAARDAADRAVAVARPAWWRLAGALR